MRPAVVFEDPISEHAFEQSLGLRRAIAALARR